MCGALTVVDGGQEGIKRGGSKSVVPGTLGRAHGGLGADQGRQQHQIIGGRIEGWQEGMNRCIPKTTARRA